MSKKYEITVPEVGENTTPVVKPAEKKEDINTVWVSGKVRREITPGIYMHFKGKPYKVLGVARHSETQELLVVYIAMYGDSQLYVRPLEMFASFVDREKYPEAKQMFRFERIAP